MRNLIIWCCSSLLLLGSYLEVTAQWNTTTIASAGKNKPSVWPRIAQDNRGTVHIVFSGDRTKRKEVIYNLFYTNNSSGSFSQPVQITDLSVGGASSTVFAVESSSGTVHLIYTGGNDGGLYYLTNASGSFGLPELVRSGNSLPSSVDLVVDADGTVHAVWREYRDPIINDHYIVYSNNGDGDFSSFGEPIDLTGDFQLFDKGYPSLDIDSSGNLHVSFSAVDSPVPAFNPVEIYYMNNIGGGWPSAPTQLTSSPEKDNGSQLAVDGNDAVHIIYRTLYDEIPNSSYYEITYIENSSGQFVGTFVVRNAMWGYDFALNAAGNAFFAYWQTSDFDLYITDNRSGEFVPDVVSSQTGTMETNPDLVADGQTVHITWNRFVTQQSGDEDDVLYANNEGGEPPTGECFVQNIDMSLSFKGTGRPSKRGWTATATVLIHDDQGNPVEGATVLGHWSGLTSASDNGTTGSDGKVSLNSRRINETGTFTFTVDNIIHASLTYNSFLNEMTSKSISNASPKMTLEDGFENTPNSVPSKFRLYQNHPNPFNPETSIRFSLSKTSHVEVTIYNTLGKAIRRLVSEEYSAGEHIVRWDGQNDFGADVASGIYLYKIQAGDFRQVKKMSLLR